MKFSCVFLRRVEDKWIRRIIDAEDIYDANNKAEKILKKLKFGKFKISKVVGTVMPKTLQDKLERKSKVLSIKPVDKSIKIVHGDLG